MLNVYEGQRTMNELLARLCEAMGNADMQEGLIAAMQALLNDPSLVTGEEEAVRPLHETTDPPPSRHNKEDEVLNRCMRILLTRASDKLPRYPRYLKRRKGVILP